MNNDDIGITINRPISADLKSDAGACHLNREKEQVTSRMAYAFTMLAC